MSFIQNIPPELVVIFEPKAEIRNQRAGIVSLSADISPVKTALDSYGATLQGLFGKTEEVIKTRQAKVASVAPKAASDLPDLSTFYRVKAPADKLEQLAKDLRGLDQVKAAYVRPEISPPVLFQSALIGTDSPSTTPNYYERQGYLKAAPGGIDAEYAQSLVGGKGENIRVIDVEWGWQLTHEDLTANQGGVVAGSPSTDVNFVNHGTAVAGVIGGDQNPYGITGIVPRAIFSASSVVDQSIPQAIFAAADKLSAGDVMLLEIQIGGPQGWIAIEWYPDIFAAIKYATAKGIVVVEAAGNGNNNLDDPIYTTARDSWGFPPGSPNPFNLANPSSGAVIVGAGAPPPGTHGRDNGTDRSRLWFSNYGSRIDAQGWGVEVTTTGYGDLQGGVSQDLWYTDTFNGTSSASPVVVGAVTAVQGILRDFGRHPLTSEQARTLLRQTGSPQQWPAGAVIGSERIGNRPNLKQLIPAAVELTSWKPRANL